MVLPLDDSTISAWEQDGQEAAPLFDACGAALLIGDDPVATAEVALGIARIQARRRRVAVADLVGELPPIERLIPADAPYGLVDSFTYGVSLSKVAHPIDPARNLLIMPSGIAPLDHDAILTSDRWPRLAAGFREAGALLLAVAPVEAAGLARFLSTVDGVVLVGRATAPRVEGVRVLAHIGPRPVAAESSPSASAESSISEAPAPRVADTPADAAEVQTLPLLQSVATTGRRSIPPWVGVAAAVLLVAALAVWAVQRYLPPENATATAAQGESTATPVASAGSVDSAGAAATPDGGRVARSADPSASPAVARGAAPVAIANPEDSLAATGYAVALVEFGSVTAANSRIEQEVERRLPAVTYAQEPMVADTGRRMYLVIAGAFPNRTGAVAFLRALRAKHVLAPGDGHVVHAPIALLVQRGISRDQVSFFMNGYRLKGLPVYGLVQADGSVNLYAGAFEDVATAQSLLTTFRASGENPSVVYRTGRTL